jgi:hypothetical protein
MLHRSISFGMLRPPLCGPVRLSRRARPRHHSAQPDRPVGKCHVHMHPTSFLEYCMSSTKRIDHIERAVVVLVLCMAVGMAALGIALPLLG